MRLPLFVSFKSVLGTAIIIIIWSGGSKSNEGGLKVNDDMNINININEKR